MDKIDISSYTKAPFRTEDAALLQSQIRMVADALGGSDSATVIMKGCELSGSVISAGILCINGEMMPAEAGLKNSQGQTKYAIVENKETVVSQSTTFTDYVTKRKAVIDNVEGTVVWDNLVRYSPVGVPNYKITITISNPGGGTSNIYVKRYGTFVSITGYGFFSKSANDLLFNIGIPLNTSIDVNSSRIIHCNSGLNEIKLSINDLGNVNTLEVMESGNYSFNCSFDY